MVRKGARRAHDSTGQATSDLRPEMRESGQRQKTRLEVWLRLGVYLRGDWEVVIEEWGTETS